MGKMERMTSGGMTASEQRKSVKEFLAMGFEVDWDTATGLVKIRKPSQTGQIDAFDLVNMRRK